MVEDSRTLSCLDADEVKALAVCLIDTSRNAYVMSEHKFNKLPGKEIEQDLEALGRVKQCVRCSFWKLVSDFNPPAGFVCGDCVDLSEDASEADTDEVIVGDKLGEIVDDEEAVDLDADLAARKADNPPADDVHDAE